MSRCKFVTLIALLFVAQLAVAQGGDGFQYAAKVICGPPPGGILAPGMYRTAINVHNPLERDVAARWKVAVAMTGDKPGPISQFLPIRLAGDAAVEIDCAEVLKAARLHTRFLKGFVVIESKTELDVVAVYTAAGATRMVESLDVERVPARRLSGGGSPCPDLIVESIEKPVWDSANHRSVIRATIKNVGNAIAPASTARVVDPSTIDPTTTFPYDATAVTPALNPGESTTVTFYLPYWVYNPDVILEVTADYKHGVPECDENNNVKVFKDIG